jgi:acetyl-CoA acetyltransferase
MSLTVIVEALRTPRGTAKETGSLHGVAPVELLAGWSPQRGPVTIDRFCASCLSAVNAAALPGAFGVATATVFERVN